MRCKGEGVATTQKGDTEVCGVPCGAAVCEVEARGGCMVKPHLLRGQLPTDRLLELGQELRAAHVCLVTKPPFPRLDAFTALFVLLVNARVVPDRDVAARVLDGEAAQCVDHFTLHHVLSIPVAGGQTGYWWGRRAGGKVGQQSGGAAATRRQRGARRC